MLDELTKKIDTLQSEVKEIRDALLGNEFYQKKGVVERQNDHEQRILKLEKNWNKTVWFLFGVGMASGLTVGKLVSAFAEYLHSK